MNSFTRLIKAVILLATFVTHLKSQINYDNPYTFTTITTGVSANGVAIDSSGLIYIADTGTHTIKKINSSGVAIIIAGSAGANGGADGAGANARFNNPTGIAVDSAGILYVVDQGNHCIRKITPDGMVTTLAGLIGLSGSTDGTGTAARFNNPTGIAIDASGYLYVTDTNNHTIRKISQLGAVTTLAGKAGISGYLDGAGDKASFLWPKGIAVSLSGEIYCTDQNSDIRKITQGGVVTTYAGSLTWGCIDGNGVDSAFMYPQGIAADGAGNLFVADTSSSTIRKINSTGSVTTIGGTPFKSGYSDGTGADALFNNPVGIAASTNGQIYIMNSGRLQRGALSLATLISSKTITCQQGVALNYKPIFSVAQITSFAAAGLPSGLTINSATGEISGETTAAIGAYTISLSATTSSGTSSAIITINVYAKNYINGLRFTNAPSSMFISQKYKPNVEVTYQDGSTVINPPDLTISSDSNLLSKVNYDFVAARSGTATIVANIGGIIKSIEININPIEIVDVSGSSLASPAKNYRILVPVVVINYLPTTDGINLDLNKAPWYGDQASLDSVKTRAIDIQVLTKYGIEEGSKFKGFNVNGLDPEVGVQIIKYVNVYETNYVPMANSGGNNRPDVVDIFKNIGLQELVDNSGVKEVWLNLFPISSEYALVAQKKIPQTQWINFWESYMSSPSSGNVSNSDRLNTVLPIYKNTYVVYGQNLARTHAENIHNRGHQIEAPMYYIDKSASGTGQRLFQNLFVGYPSTGNPSGRCGNVHFPPNGTSDYDWNNSTAVLSDIQSWQPSGGPKVPVLNSNWMSRNYSYPNQTTFNPKDIDSDPQYKWLIYWFQAIPGYGNKINYGASEVSDWWDIFYNWDDAISKNRTLWQTPGTVIAPGAPSTVSVTVGNAIAYLNFDSPKINGGSSIVNYRVNAVPSNGGAVITSVGTGSPMTISGLNNGVSYKFSIAAFNGSFVGSYLYAAGEYIPSDITAPFISSQPSSTSAIIGSSTSFAVSAASNAPLSYQWNKDGAAISGATSSTYTIATTKTTDAGSYTVVVTNSAGSVTSQAAQLTVLNPGRLTNLSVLSLDGPGAQLLTVGFVSGGLGTTGSQNLLIRGIGPTLGAAPFNVPNVLPDPTLSVFNSSSGVVASNDNWSAPASNATAVTAADAATGAFALTSTTSLDAALVTNLTAGGYSVQVAGKNGATGNVIAEVYDNTPIDSYSVTTPRLVNLSCLEQVSSGGILSAGFVIGGSTAEQVLIRASGPTLGAAPFNVPGTIPDPKVTVFNSSSAVLATNAGWGGSASITAANKASGAFQFASGTSKDSAVLLTLQPGAYTVQAASASGTAGVTLIEVYEVPSN